MCRSILGLIIFFTVLWSAASEAQSTSQTSPLTGTTPRETSPLLARSEMQAPKPIPVIRPLRFQEIPISPRARRGADHESVASDDSPVSAEKQQESEPAVLVLPQADIAH